VLVTSHPNNAPNILYNLTTFTANDPRRVDVRGQTLRVAADPVCAGTGLVGIAVNTTCPVAVALGANEYSLRVPRTNERRRDGKYGTNLLIGNGSWSYYNALQIEYKKRLSNGISFQAAYTWSKAIDTTSEATNVGAAPDSNFNGPNTRNSRGYSLFHSPQRFTLFGSYKLPFFDKRKDILGRNTFFGDGLNNVDFAFSKNFAMPFESHRLSVRADLFNAFNKIRYGFPNRTYTSAAFGTINTAVNAARVIQVSLRYSF
ncbi:MAG: hypothetical protein ABL952_17960, partial [Pyrinomonadaceae bacterium]